MKKSIKTVIDSSFKIGRKKRFKRKFIFNQIDRNEILNPINANIISNIKYQIRLLI